MNRFDQLRAYYRFKSHYPIKATVFPWKRRKSKRQLSVDAVTEIVRTSENIIVPVCSNESETRHVQIKGHIDTAMYWVIQRYVKQGSLAMDIGANYGYISALMADKVGDTGQVYAFEPNTDLHPYARRLFSLNRLFNIEIYECACSDSEGEGRFAVDKGDHTMSKIAEEGERVVPLRTLDSIVAKNTKSVSFLKIDVEGYEASVLKGSLKCLTESRPVLVFETGLHSQEDINCINGLLDSAKYEVIGVINDWGITASELTLNMTAKTHCNVLALPL